MGYDLTDNLYSFLYSEEEATQDEEIDEDEYALLLQERLEEQLQIKQELLEELDRVRQKVAEKNQQLLQQADEIFSLFAQLADLALGEERAHFIHQKTAESFQSDKYIMQPEESTVQFLKRLTLEFEERNLRDETENEIHTDRHVVIKRFGMFLTEQERIDLHFDIDSIDD